MALNGTSLDIVEGLAMLTVDLSPLADDTDADPSNELQALSFDDQTRMLALSAGNQVAIPDAQTLSVNAGTLSVSGGNTVNLPGQLRTFYVSPGA